MDQPADDQTTPSKSSSQNEQPATVPPSARTLYLILYNFISAVLWSAVLGRVALIATLYAVKDVYPGTQELVKWVQTLAALEVVHSLVGLVRASLPTTLMQVASRFLLVWGIAHFFPSTTAYSPAYSYMLFAWSATEVIRYSYFAVNLAYGRVPAALTWLRYNTFFVLYPLGIASECSLVWLATGPAKRLWGRVGEVALWAVLVVYVPGAYVLYSHMMAQRRKVLRPDRGKKTA